MGEAVRTRGLRKVYTDGTQTLEVLKGVDLEIKSGEKIALMGPSGAGKSTLLHILGLMDSATSGEIRVLGQDALALGEEGKDRLRSEQLGFLFQFHYLLPGLTLLENASLPLRILGRKEKESLEASRSLLESVGLSARLDHFPSQVSGGEQQRAALARAMAAGPKLLICDEPTGNLDRERGEEVRKLIWQTAEREGTTVILATHNPELAGAADRIVRISDGRIVV